MGAREREGEAPRARWPWIGPALQALCLLFAVVVIGQDLGSLLVRAHVVPPSRGLGMFPDSLPDGGLARIVLITPGGPVARVGAVAGDRMITDRMTDIARPLRPDERVGITLDHGGRRSHLFVQAAPPTTSPDRPDTAFRQINGAASILATMFGAFIVWRSRRRRTAMLLGAALIAYGMTSAAPRNWPTDPALYALVFWTCVNWFLAIPVLFYGFALSFFRDCVGPPRRWELAIFWSYAVISIALGNILYFVALHGPALPAGPPWAALFGYLPYLGFLACLAYVVRGWRKSAAALQQRYALMLVATSAIVIAQAWDNINDTSAPAWEHIAHMTVNSILVGGIASSLYAYSILRHRVFDLGFAVNRTLVYTAVSAILLVGFGLVEWASDHLLPLAGREKNALIDAGVALAIFLTFHRLRDVMERVIEGMFFRSWREKEKSLRSFVRDAAFILKPKALERAAAQALSRFADGAAAALYLRSDGGDYLRGEGGVAGAAEGIDPDHPALVALRARRTALEGAELEMLGEAGLALPMINRAELMGFVLLGHKPSGLSFRPDEVELLSWATGQIGLDLHALKVEQLETLAGRQRQEIDLLRAREGLRPAEA